VVTEGMHPNSYERQDRVVGSAGCAAANLKEFKGDKMEVEVDEREELRKFDEHTTDRTAVGSAQRRKGRDFSVILPTAQTFTWSMLILTLYMVRYEWPGKKQINLQLQ
jgi:hypothetical protein